jgi:hypothetical protein
MSPALGLLVGHDEDGFTMLNDKKTMLDSEDNAKDGVADEKPKLKSKPDDKKQRKNSKVDTTNQTDSVGRYDETALGIYTLKR